MPINQSITVLPTPPSRADPDNFDSRADAFLSALPTMQTQMNTWAGEANSTATAINNDKLAAQSAKTNAETAETNAETAQGLAESARNTATTQAGIATTQAGIATTQAGIATTQAGIATTQAGLADAARVAAEDARDGAVAIALGEYWPSGVSMTEVGYLDGVTSAIQSQLNGKADSSKGVTNGDSHDHNGGDGAQIAYSSLSGLPTLGTAAATASTDYAPAANGVTNGDSHNHDGGDGAQIAYSSLSGTPTLGDSASKNVGTTTGTVAAGDHTHSGVYEPADATILKSAAIGSTVQGYDADLSAIAGLANTDGNIIVGNGSTWVVESGATARTSLGLGTTDSPAFLVVSPTNGIRSPTSNNTAGAGNAPHYHLFDQNTGIKTFHTSLSSSANQGIKIHFPGQYACFGGTIHVRATYDSVNALGYLSYEFIANGNNGTDMGTSFAVRADRGETSRYFDLKSITHTTGDHIFEFRRTGIAVNTYYITFELYGVLEQMSDSISTSYFEVFTYTPS